MSQCPTPTIGCEGTSSNAFCVLMNTSEVYLSGNMERLRLNPGAKEFVPPGNGFQVSWQSYSFQKQVTGGHVHCSKSI